MIPTLTIGTAASVVLGLMATAFTANGIRWGYLDEIAVGGTLFVIAWMLLEVGPTL